MSKAFLKFKCECLFEFKNVDEKRQILNIKYSNKKTAMYVELCVCMSPLIASSLHRWNITNLGSGVSDKYLLV